MNTTDNYRQSASNETPEGQVTQEQLDREEQDRLVKAEVSAPISESQVQPGQELVDGNGRRDTPDVEATRPDILVDKDAVTQSKIDAMDEQQLHANKVQDKETKKLNQNTKPGRDASDSDK